MACSNRVKARAVAAALAVALAAVLALVGVVPEANAYLGYTAMALAMMATGYLLLCTPSHAKRREEHGQTAWSTGSVDAVVATSTTPLISSAAEATALQAAQATTLSNPNREDADGIAQSSADGTFFQTPAIVLHATPLASTSTGITRAYYLDNIKSVLTAIVVFHHTTMTFGSGSGWYLIYAEYVALLGFNS